MSLQLTPGANGAMIAGISSAVFVGNGSAIATAPITVSVAQSTTTKSISQSRSGTLLLVTPSSCASAQRCRGAAEMLPAHADMGQLESTLRRLHSVGTIEQNTIRKTQSLPATQGAQANLWVQYFRAGTAGASFTQVPATLALQTAHANIWVDNSLSALLGNPTALAQIGANIETAIASDTLHFGSASWDTIAPSLHQAYATCDANGNRTNAISPMFIVPSDPHVNFFYVALSRIGVGGYMDVDSLSPESVVRCAPAANGRYHSNEAPLIVLAYYGDTRGMQYVLKEDSIVHPAHEYQHLINAVHHAILQSTPKFEDSLLNEGLSMVAQDLALSSATNGTYPIDDENVYRTTFYFAAPQNYSVAGFAGIDPQGGSPQFNCATCYSPAWLFQRYLYDRFGGDAYAHAMESGSSTSWGELQSATGVTPATLLHDFAVALAASNTSAATDPRYRFGAVNLRASYTDQFGSTSTLSGPAPLDTLQNSATKTYSILVGAYAYFSAAAGTGNVNITLTDGTNGAFGLAGAVVAY